MPHLLTPPSQKETIHNLPHPVTFHANMKKIYGNTAMAKVFPQQEHVDMIQEYFQQNFQTKGGIKGISYVQRWNTIFTNGFHPSSSPVHSPAKSSFHPAIQETASRYKTHIHSDAVTGPPTKHLKTINRLGAQQNKENTNMALLPPTTMHATRSKKA